jgi:hypothetical protein
MLLLYGGFGYCTLLMLHSMHHHQLCILWNTQVCPYDCRHTLATVSSHAALAAKSSLQDSQQYPTQEQQNHAQNTSQPLQDPLQPQQQEQEQQGLHLYVYESEPEVLARHMLLLALLFDAALPVRTRAEMFLELHGNAVLRQKTADYLGGQPHLCCAGLAMMCIQHCSSTPAAVTVIQLGCG